LKILKKDPGFSNSHCLIIYIAKYGQIWLNILVDKNNYLLFIIYLFIIIIILTWKNRKDFFFGAIDMNSHGTVIIKNGYKQFP
jgi:hypothetical protein